MSSRRRPPVEIRRTRLGFGCAWRGLPPRRAAGAQTRLVVREGDEEEPVQIGRRRMQNGRMESGMTGGRLTAGGVVAGGETFCSCLLDAAEQQTAPVVRCLKPLRLQL